MQVRLLGHNVHPMLIVFPLGLLAASVGFDLLWYATGRDGFATTAGHLVVAGVVSAPIVALSGLLDWLTIPTRTRARELGLLHGLGNLVVVALFAVSALLRYEGDTWEPEPIAFVLSLVGAGLAIVTAWMGGELVERLGVGVHEGANPDAPSSLRSSTVPAREGPAAG